MGGQGGENRGVTGWGGRAGMEGGPRRDWGGRGGEKKGGGDGVGGGLGWRGVPGGIGGGGRGGDERGERRVIITCMLHCHLLSDFCIMMGSHESHRRFTESHQIVLLVSILSARCWDLLNC